MHYHLDTNPSSIAKRDRSRLMNRCTDPSMRGWTFTRSACSRAGGLRSLTILCHDHTHIRAAVQNCAINEFCVDTGYPANEAKAYCVSSDNFFRVPLSERQRVTGEFALHLPVSRGRLAANALLVDQTRRNGLEGAELFELAAWRSRERGVAVERSEWVAGAEEKSEWKGEVGVGVGEEEAQKRASVGETMLDSVHCAGCYDLRLQPLAPETDLLKALVNIWHAQPGLLYLITIS